MIFSYRLLTTILIISLTFSCKREGHVFYTKTKINTDSITDSLMKQPFYKASYSFLDQDKNIHTNDLKRICLQYGYNYNSIKNYNDSLRILLQGFYNDFRVSRVAFIQITYDWQRVSQHLWLSQNECKEKAELLHITYPYQMMAVLNSDSAKQNRICNEILLKLQSTLEEKFNAKQLDTCSSKQLIALAYANHPDIIKFREQPIHKHEQ
jgi:hypothetical protein